MTREERKIALHCLKAYSDYHSEVCEECINYPNCDHKMQDDVTETIIKALEQETCEDAVSRQALLDMATTIETDDFSGNEIIEVVEIDDIKNLPPITPQLKTGRWTPGDPICPCCGEDKFKDLDADIWSDWRPKYCPNCGSRMESEEQKNCDTCTYSDEVDGSHCYECVKGMRNNYKAESKA